MRVSRPLAAVGSLPVLTLVATIAVGAPAGAAAQPRYVALGDSYSSGTGTRAYLADGTSCQRSVRAYPSLVAAAGGLSLNLRACSGATTSDIATTQLSALDSGVAKVTISAGGNDAGFAGVLTECAMPGWASNCNGKIDAATTFIKGTLPSRLNTLYGSIRTKAPNASVAVVGYPRIFMGEDCNAFTWFSPTEQSRLNATADLLNATLKTAATKAGFTFVNPTTAFTGHAVCDSPEWINGLSSPISESYHPNVAGHQSGYTPIVSAPVLGARRTVTSGTLRTADASTAEQTSLQRRYAAADRRIKPKVFRAPDLSSERVRRAAERAGVDLSSRASIDAADRRHSAAQAAQRTG